MNKREIIVDWTKKGIGGLTVASVVWIYTTFSTKNELQAVRETNAKQWQAIGELRVAVGINNRTNR